MAAAASSATPPQPISAVRRLKAPLEGWYAVQGRTVILSMVISLDEGKGHVTGLLTRWMTRYDEIQVPTPSNRMRGICERRGFKPEWIWAPEFNEHVECMVWRKPAA
jgi:hypothetical protein